MAFDAQFWTTVVGWLDFSRMHRLPVRPFLVLIAAAWQTHGIWLWSSSSYFDLQAGGRDYQMDISNTVACSSPGENTLVVRIGNELLALSTYPWASLLCQPDCCCLWHRRYMPLWALAADWGSLKPGGLLGNTLTKDLLGLCSGFKEWQMGQCSVECTPTQKASGHSQWKTFYWVNLSTEHQSCVCHSAPEASTPTLHWEEQPIK